MPLLHATCVALNDAGILIRGPAGSGKSDLALCLIDEGAVLIADDYCTVISEDGQLVAHTPEAIAGQIEIRGYGIVRVPYKSSIRLKLLVDLVKQAEIERHPETAYCQLYDLPLRHIELDPTRPSTTAKVRLALKQIPEDTN